LKKGLTLFDDWEKNHIIQFNCERATRRRKLLGSIQTRPEKVGKDVSEKNIIRLHPLLLLLLPPHHQVKSLQTAAPLILPAHLGTRD
jgi:hypothetical protein